MDWNFWHPKRTTSTSWWWTLRGSSMTDSGRRSKWGAVTLWNEMDTFGCFHYCFVVDFAAPILLFFRTCIPPFYFLSFRGFPISKMSKFDVSFSAGPLTHDFGSPFKLLFFLGNCGWSVFVTHMWWSVTLSPFIPSFTRILLLALKSLKEQLHIFLSLHVHSCISRTANFIHIIFNFLQKC